MTDPIRAAAQALLAAIDCKYIDECDAEINAMRAALSAPQPAADERTDALRRALEIIAVGDSKNPQVEAAEELIALGYWRDIAAGLEDAEMLDAFEAQINWQLSFSWGENEPWQIRAVTCDRSDREWCLVFKGKTVREAIRAAMKGTP